MVFIFYIHLAQEIMCSDFVALLKDRCPTLIDTVLLQELLAHLSLDRLALFVGWLI